MRSPYDIPTFDPQTGDLHVIIDAPRGSRNKYGWSEEYSLFEMTGVLPAGYVFPFDFGSIPSTRGEDGDPLDILVLMDAPAFVGCLVRCRLLGVIEAEQTEDGKTERNDRLLAVAAKARHREALDESLLEEIEHFFASFNQAKGKQFKTLGRGDAAQARRIIERNSVRK